MYDIVIPSWQFNFYLACKKNLYGTIPRCWQLTHCANSTSSDISLQTLSSIITIMLVCPRCGTSNLQNRRSLSIHLARYCTGPTCLSNTLTTVTSTPHSFYNPVLLLHNDIWHNADNICGNHQQKCRNNWNDRQVGCRTAAIVPKLNPNTAFS